MLVTAQRVIAPDGHQGVNVFRFDEPPRDWPSDPTLLFSEPRTLVAYREQVPQGGNRLRSYLDLLGPESITTASAVYCVQRLLAAPGPPSAPVVVPELSVAIRFAVDAGLLPAWRLEAEVLLQHLHELLPG